MPVTAGIIGIIVGILQVPFLWFFQGLHEVEVGPLDVKAWLAIAVFTLLAIFAIVGGIYHIFRKRWPLAMVGSVAVTLLLYSASKFFVLLGIAAIVLTVLSRKEFR
jgi:hypothetical protein